MPCAEKKIGIASHINSRAPAKNMIWPRSGLKNVITETSKKAGRPKTKKIPSQMIERKVVCLTDFHSETRFRLECYAGYPIIVDGSNQPTHQDQQQRPANDPENEPASRFGGAPSGDCPGISKLNRLVAPTGNVRRIMNRLNWFAKTCPGAAGWSARPVDWKAKHFAIEGRLSINGWKKLFKRRCGPSHRNRSSSTGGRMTMMLLGDDQIPAPGRRLILAAEGSLPFSVSIGIDSTTRTNSHECSFNGAFGGHCLNQNCHGRLICSN